MTVRTRFQLLSDAAEFIPDNINRAVSPADIRQRIIDLAESMAMGTEVESFPEGGTPGQVLVKASDDDFDTAWETVAVLTEGVRGDIEIAAGSDPLTIAPNAVDDTKLRDSAALSVIGRSANSSGDPADIAAGTTGHVLRRSGTTLGFGTLEAGAFAANTAPLATLANVAARTVLGNTTGSTGAVAAIAPGQLPATQTNDSAATGAHGEYVESVVAVGSAVTLSGLTGNVTSISLTAGDWDVNLNATFSSPAATTVTSINVGISATSATFDTSNGRFASIYYGGATVGATIIPTLHVPPVRFSLASTTTVYFCASSAFGGTPVAAYGVIRARRVR